MAHGMMANKRMSCEQKLQRIREILTEMHAEGRFLSPNVKQTKQGLFVEKLDKYDEGEVDRVTHNFDVDERALEEIAEIVGWLDEELKCKGGKR